MNSLSPGKSPGLSYCQGANVDKADILRAAWKHRAHDFARATLIGAGIDPGAVIVPGSRLAPQRQQMDDVARFVAREFRTINRYTRSIEL